MKKNKNITEYFFILNILLRSLILEQMLATL